MNKPYPIFPSVLAFDFADLRTQVALLTAAGASALHFDIMDNQFVPNLTFGPMVLKALKAHTPLPCNAHLMVYTPEALVAPMADAGATRLYLHPESTPHIHRALGQVREAGMEAAVAINPGTPLVVLEPLLAMIDAVLVMSVNPGFGGQAFIPAAIGRVAALREMVARSGAPVEIECDGGVDRDTIAPLVRAGMTGAVIGTALFRDGDPAGELQRIRQAADGAR